MKHGSEYDPCFIRVSSVALVLGRKPRTDPARRVKLKISHERLARLHPADIADIIEELAPKEREAVFETLDEEIAAGALEEVQPRVKKSILESLDSERAADIVQHRTTAIRSLLGDTG